MSHPIEPLRVGYFIDRDGNGYRIRVVHMGESAVAAAVVKSHEYDAAFMLEPRMGLEIAELVERGAKPWL